MNKFALVFLPFLFTAFGYKAMAQEDSNTKREESQEIIIQKKGDKDTKMTIEITGDKVLINGKPLVEFNEDGITVKKKKMIIRDGDRFSFADGFKGPEARSFGWSNDENESRAFLGVSTEKAEKGARIIEITKESAAEKAGLQKDDIITRFGDTKIDGPQTLADAVKAKKPSDEVKVYYTRNGKEKSVKATLQEKKGTTRSFSFTTPDGSFKTFTMPEIPPAPGMEGLESLKELEELRHLAPQFGDNNFDFKFNTFPRKQKLGLKIQDTEEGNGVKILEVADSSAAATAGLKKDDIITEIGGKKVNNTDEAREELMDNEEKSKYNMKVRRNGTDMTVEIKIPKKLKTVNL